MFKWIKSLFSYHRRPIATLVSSLEMAKGMALEEDRKFGYDSLRNAATRDIKYDIEGKLYHIMDVKKVVTYGGGWIFILNVKEV